MLRDDQDAFGHEVMDYFNGAKVVEIIERDDGTLHTTSGPASYFAPFRKWHPPERAAMRYVRGKVLDVGSGAGRIALHLQKHGHEVMCLDNSPLALEVCRLRGAKPTVGMSVYQVSRSLGPFDTILMMGGNLGLLGDAETGRRLLERFRRVTNPKARIIGVTRDPYDTNEPRHLAYHERNRRRGRRPGQIRMRVRYLNYKSPWFDYMLQSREELGTMLESTGWHLRRTIDSDVGFYVAVIERV